MRDTLTFLKRSKKIFKLEEKAKGHVFWSGVFIQPLGENIFKVKNHECDETSHFQIFFINTKLTNKSLIYNKKETVFDILNNVGFYDMKPTKSFISARMKDALYNVPKTIPKILDSFLPAYENEENSYEKKSAKNLEGQGIGKSIIPTDIVDIYSRIEILLGLKLFGHTKTLTEGSNSNDELYKRGEIQKNNNIECS